MSRTKLQEPPHLLADLKELCLPAVTANWERVGLEAERKRQGHPEYLAELAHLEVTQRRERRIARRIRDARFPVLKTLDGFDFAAQPELDREAVLELFRCEFVDRKHNVVLIGGIGTGKTHLAIALGLAGCQREKRVLFTTAAETTNALVEAKQQGRLSRKLESLGRYDVIVLDELGYVPFDRQGADLLFGLVTKVYERKSLVVTTNLPFARWSEVFLDATAAAAVIDRLVHHATILKTEGESYRLQAAQALEPRQGEAPRGGPRPSHRRRAGMSFAPGDGLPRKNKRLRGRAGRPSRQPRGERGSLPSPPRPFEPTPHHPSEKSLAGNLKEPGRNTLKPK